MKNDIDYKLMWEELQQFLLRNTVDINNKYTKKNNYERTIIEQTLIKVFDIMKEIENNNNKR
jgi:hypothetical protein